MRYLFIVLLLLPVAANTQTLMHWHTAKPSAYHPTYQGVLDYADDQAITLPSEAQKTEQNALCQCLDDAGILTDLDVLLVAEGSPNKDFALINWVDPGTPVPTGSGTINFDATYGLDKGSSTAYIDLNWDEGNGVAWGQNDAMMFVWQANFGSTSGADVMVGAFTTSSGYGSVLGYDGTNTSTDLQEGNQAYDSGFDTGENAYAIDRAASGAWKVYENGTELATNNYSFAGEYTGDMFIFALNLTGSANNHAPSGTDLYFLAIGGSMQALQDELYDCVNTYVNDL